MGDTLTLNFPDGSTTQLAITGIMDDDATNMILGSASAILLTPEGLSSIQTADLSSNWQYVVRFSLLTNVGSSIADIQQQNGISDAQITQNEELLSMLGQLPGPLQFYDVQKLYAIAYDPEHERRSLEYAIDFLEMDKDIPFHRAFSDAYYTAGILKRIMRYGIYWIIKMCECILEERLMIPLPIHGTHILLQKDYLLFASGFMRRKELLMNRKEL